MGSELRIMFEKGEIVRFKKSIKGRDLDGPFTPGLLTRPVTSHETHRNNVFIIQYSNFVYTADWVLALTQEIAKRYKIKKVSWVKGKYSPISELISTVLLGGIPYNKKTSFKHRVLTKTLNFMSSYTRWRIRRAYRKAAKELLYGKD